MRNLRTKSALVVAVVFLQSAFSQQKSFSDQLPLTAVQNPNAVAPWSAAADDTLLPSDSLQFGGILHNDGWTVFRLGQNEIRQLPFREISNYLPLIPGVSVLNGSMHIRADRDGAPTYLLNGFNVTSPFDNSAIVSLIPEVIDELQVHTGAFGAEFGRSTAGIVLSRMRTGGDTLHVGVHLLSDDFARSGGKALGTTVYGYRNFVLTAGGPILPGLNFFVAGQHNFMRDRQPMFLNAFRFDSLRVDNSSSRYLPGFPADSQPLLPGPIEFNQNSIPGNKGENDIAQGNVTADLWGVHLQALGSYEHRQTVDGGQWPYVFQNYYRQKRNMIQKEQRTFVGIHARHDIAPDLSYGLSIGYYDRTSSLTDPDFGDNWQLYTDSLANAQLGYTGFRRYYSGPLNWNTWSGFLFLDPNAPNNKYQKNHDRSYQLSAEGEAGITDSWTLRAGASSEWWSFRKYSIGNVGALMEALYSTTGKNPQFSSDEERRSLMIISGQRSMEFYGFNVDGQEVESDPDAARSPRYSSAYVESIVKDSNYVLKAGVRFERYDLRLQYFPGNLNYIPLNSSQWPDESQYSTTQAKSVVLPRLSFSIAPTRNTSVFAAYGMYAQPIRLQDILLTGRDFYKYAFPEYGSADYQALRGVVQGQFLSPEKISQYEAGLSTSREDMSAGFTARIFYKRLEDLAQLAIDPDASWVFKNDGLGSAYGADVTLKLRPSHRFSVTLNYSLSDVHGTESSPRSNWATLVSSDTSNPLPKALYPLEYGQVHRGSLIAELSFDDQDGPFLDGLHLSGIMTFSSGHRFTFTDIQDLGQTSVWTVGVYSLTDPSYAHYTESPNASTTPWLTNVDVHAEYLILKLPLRITASLDVLNIFDTREVTNVYPTSGSASDDGWLSSNVARSGGYASIPNYVNVYRILNLQNRWAYMNTTGYDLYNPPRQFRVGLMVEM